MAFFASNPLRQKQHCSIPLCKCPSLLNSFKFRTSSSFLTFPLSKHPLRLSFLVGRAHVSSHYETKVSIKDQQRSKSSTNHRYGRRAVSKYSHFRDKNKSAEQKSAKKGDGSDMGENVGTSARRDRFSGERVGSTKRSRMGSGLSSMSPEDEDLLRKLTETIGNLAVKKEEKKPKKGVDKKLRVEKMDKGSKKSKSESPEVMLRVGLDMCSKKGDVVGALELYDSARREGIKIGQYHYNVLLYLCSSAAIGVVQPAKSGSGNRTLSTVESIADISAVNSEVLGEVGEIHAGNFNNTKSNNPTSYSELLVKSDNNPIRTGRTKLDLNGFVTNVGKENLSSILNGKEKFARASNGVPVPSYREIDVTRNFGSGDYDFESTNGGNKLENYQIRVNEDLKKYALQRGFEVYEKMCLEKIPMNEASLTSVARMALAMGDGDMAFDTVKQMKALGINPRLRSYGPALSAFCTSGNVEKAFSVEQHMQENGVHPEEPELEMLLRVSIEAGRSDKVYYLLHKLRTGVRRVSPSTADLIEKWFKSKVASQVGKRKWDQSFITEAIENGGGGWHGQGWLGKGKWTVSRTSVGDDGLCKCCGEKLAIIDLDPKETEKFAESVASIAVQREKNSSFQKFQKWLDYYGPFEAVVDGANIGLYNQRKFKPSKVNAVVNGIRQLLPSKKWPLVVLHNRRIIGYNMDKPINKALVEKWKNADALYATPNGSNDDWYWLYAAIKFKCLIVTNDEMRDHLFQLLGNDFFPKWKERHQVHFSFSDIGPVFRMPPPCSVVIQESEKGHWHIPVASELDYEEERTWLCVTHADSSRATLGSLITQEGSQLRLRNKASRGSDTQKKVWARPTPLNHGNLNNCRDSKNTQESYSNLRNILITTAVSDCPTILPQIEAAEKLGNCVINFEI